MAETGYLNFDLEVEPTSGGYRAQVLSSPAGEARAELDAAAFSRVDLAGSAQAVGAQLFDAVFQGEVLSCLRRSVDEAGRDGHGLRIRLRLDEAPELIPLPWEYLYDHTRDRFLALSSETPLVRYMDLPEPARGMEPGPRLRVLAVIASPDDQPGLDTGREWANLQAALDPLASAGTVQLDRLAPASMAAFQEQLLRQEYHILHFVGHGVFEPEAHEGVLLLVGPDGHSQLVTGQNLSTLLGDHRSLRLALLNACQAATTLAEDPYAGVAQKLVRGGIPAVIAMRTAISDAAGVTLARSFYTALAEGVAVDAALAEARKTLYAGGYGAEWGTPALYMRAADGNLWPRQTVSAPSARTNLRRVLLAAAAAITLLVIASLAAYFLIAPAQMDARSTMNVAVAEIGWLDDQGRMQPAEESGLIRGWIVDALTTASAGEAAGANRVAVWHDGLAWPQKRGALGIVAGQTAEERAAAAVALAQRVRADVVIYGHIEGSGAGRRFVQEFYLTPRLQPEANETIGRYQLGEPIPLPASLREADTLAREAVAGRVSTRANAVFRLILALRADILGQHEDALALLRQAEGDLKGWGERGEGKETLYYFIARQALYLRRYDEALAAARRSQASNASYPRAYIVLGGVWLQQAQGLPAAERLRPGGLFEQAEQAQTTATDLAVAGRDTRMEIIARLALAAVHIAQGIAHYDLDTPAGDAEANRRLELAATEVRPLLAPLEEIKQVRLLAQAYSYIGAARLEQGSLAHRHGDIVRATAAFGQARDALQGCIDQGPKAPEDRTLNGQIIAEMCQPYQEIALSALKGFGGAP